MVVVMKVSHQLQIKVTEINAEFEIFEMKFFEKKSRKESED
jgi:hypothetical protein